MRRVPFLHQTIISSQIQGIKAISMSCIWPAITISLRKFKFRFCNLFCQIATNGELSDKMRGRKRSNTSRKSKNVVKCAAIRQSQSHKGSPIECGPQQSQKQGSKDNLDAVASPDSVLGLFHGFWYFLRYIRYL